MLSKLRRHFFVGVFAIAPFALTVYLVVLLAGWFDSQFQPIIQVISRNLGYDRPIPGLGIAFGVVTIIFVGMMTPSFVGKWFFGIIEKFVEKIPLAKVVYSATRQIFDAFSQSSDQKFRRVVMVPFMKEGAWAIGFVTKEVKQGWVPGRPETKLSVFVPTTPNPTSGFLLFVDTREALPLNISVEDGLKLVISAGLTKPEYLDAVENA
ncbi:MAG: hypothetical protein COV44_05145 [Deltaproteobacteria bacterium CG11_big_fil_rev_8_21_14_0_20_45_16]|nr:MAG: hypothetical protein COV44_05145 [Deltaproteobacteria bacterium CG11_big_fil_rev_8_21_14_0_20_45_16]